MCSKAYGIFCTMPMKQIRIYGLLLLLLTSMMAWGQELSVAERNAAQGFNDTIDRLAPDFVWVSLCIADPTTAREDALGTSGHAFLRNARFLGWIIALVTKERVSMLTSIVTLAGRRKWACLLFVQMNIWRITGNGIARCMNISWLCHPR